jgi:hypothetical protein
MLPWLALLFVTQLPWALAAEPAGVDAQARQLLETSTRYLASQKRFTVDTQSTIEVVLHSGQKIQFDHSVTLAVQRPNKLRARRIGDLIDQHFYYDGKSLTLHIPDDDYYATLPAPETLEGMLDFARESLDIVAPAGDLIYRNASEILLEHVTSGFVVGKSVVNGVRCDHLAFSDGQTDWQIWIQDGSSPLPRRFVVTSRDVQQAPQFSVQMTRWDLAPVLDEQMFEFRPPEGANQIEFLSPANARAQVH